MNSPSVYHIFTTSVSLDKITLISHQIRTDCTILIPQTFIKGYILNF